MGNQAFHCQQCERKAFSLQSRSPLSRKAGPFLCRLTMQIPCIPARPRGERTRSHSKPGRPLRSSASPANAPGKGTVPWLQGAQLGTRPNTHLSHAGAVRSASLLLTCSFLNPNTCQSYHYHEKTCLSNMLWSPFAKGEMPQLLLGFTASMFTLFHRRHAPNSHSTF